MHLKWHCKWAYKIHISLLHRFMFITSLSVVGYEYYLTITGKLMELYYRNSAIRQLQIPKQVCYMVMKQTFKYTTKGIYSGIYLWREPINIGIHSSPSKTNIKNSVVLALLTQKCSINECMIYHLIPRISVLFWHNDSIMRSNKQNSIRNSYNSLVLLFYKQTRGRESRYYTFNHLIELKWIAVLKKQRCLLLNMAWLWSGCRVLSRFQIQ